MPKIGYESSGFKGPLASFNGKKTLTCTWAQLAWAAVTVGKAYGDEAANGIFSTYERIHRAALIYAFLVESETGTIMKAGTYINADPTEKGNISYAIGMTLTKLFSEVYLSVSRLLHYGVYSGSYSITTAAGKSRPDLIGTTTAGDWVVFESKGRSNELEDGVLASAKQQAEQISTIGGLAPICRVGAAAYFAPELRFALTDPAAKGHRTIDLKRTQFLDRYEKSLRRLSEDTGRKARRRIDGRDYVGTRYDDADLFLSFVPPSSKNPPIQMADRKLTNRAYLGGDGLLVEVGTSWSTDEMKLEPPKR